MIREQLVLVFSGDDTLIEPPDSTDAWHPRDVVPLEDAWEGGDNLDDPLDYVLFQTGESNTGPHDSISWSHEDLSGIIQELSDWEDDGSLLEPVSDEDLSEDREPDEQEVEREDIVIRIKKALKDAGVSGETGLMSNVDNPDEFEDLIRFMFDSVGLDNKNLAGVAIRIGQDFLEAPETAAAMSTFNL
jgi:hypothetical protein